jgi:hypothetical protein
MLDRKPTLSRSQGGRDLDEEVWKMPLYEVEIPVDRTTRIRVPRVLAVSTAEAQEKAAEIVKAAILELSDPGGPRPYRTTLQEILNSRVTN